jgi:hypothetical protein
VLAAYARRYELVPASVDADTLALAGRLEGRHVVAAPANVNPAG